MTSTYFVYILGSENQTLYVGVTNNLIKRVYEHKNKLIEGFTKKYNISKLLYFEEFNNIQEAIQREKQLKHWNRAWKIELIETKNPIFEDLYGKII